MRRLAAVALLVVLALAGCLSGSPTGPSPTPGVSSAPDSVTPTLGTTGRAATNAEADHAIRVRNRWNRSVVLTLRVVRERTGDVVYERTWSRPPSGPSEVYNLARADPDGVETFAVTLRFGEASATVHVATSACYGDVTFTVTASGGLDWTYTRC